MKRPAGMCAARLSLGWMLALQIIQNNALTGGFLSRFILKSDKANASMRYF